MLDPYPGKELLTSGDVMKLLSLRKTAWYALLRDEAAGFPKALVLHKAVKRWRKDEVLAFLLTRPRE